MRGRILQSILAFAVACAAFCLYWLIVVPLVEPPVTRRPVPPLPSLSPALPDRTIARFFPADAWERNNPKVLETPQGMLLFGDYLPRADGTLELKPVTLIYWPHADSGGRHAPLIVQAPGGAVLESDRPINLGRGELGKPLAGRLVGPVIIRQVRGGHETADELFITARNVHIDRQRLWTPHEVEFRYGPHWGRGRDLQLRFADRPTAESAEDKPLSMIRELQLAQLENVCLYLDDAKRNHLRLPSPEKRPTTGPAVDQVELRAAGPLRMYFPDYFLVLSNRVQLTRVTSSGVKDELQCDLLEVHFEVEAYQRHSAEGQHAFTVDRVLAKGKPVMLDLRSHDATLRAEFIEWNHRQRRLLAESAPGVRFTYSGHTLQATRLDYVMHPTIPGRPEKIVADGPGEISGQFEAAATHRVTLRWDNALQLRPNEDQYLLSVSGRVTAVVEGLATLSAAQVFLFLHDQPRETATAVHPPRKWRPDRLVAQENVRLESPWLISSRESRELRVWFVSPSTHRLPQPISAGPLRTKNITHAQTPPRFGPLRFRGDLIEAQVIAHHDFQLDDITVVGGVEITSDPQVPAHQAVLLRGDLLRVSRIGERTPIFDIQGHPAQAGLRGLLIEGHRMALDTQSQRFWLAGAGQLQTSTSVAGLTQRAPKTPIPLTIRWTDGLEFQGRSIRFHGQVVIQGHHGTPTDENLRFFIRGRELRADLTQSAALDFTASYQDSPPDLQVLWLDGPIYAENQTWDASGQLRSWDQMSAVALRVDKTTGSFESVGPGECGSVRASVSPPITAGGFNTITSSNSPPLTHIRVQFGDRVIGNFLKRELEFQQRVVAVFAPVSDWNERFDPQREIPGKDTVILHADSLTLTEMPSGSRLPPRHEVIATGNVTVRGESFTATGLRLSYDDAKDLLVLEGNTQQPATIRTAWGSGNAQARMIRVWPKSRRLQSEGIQGIDFVPPVP